MSLPKGLRARLRSVFAPRTAELRMEEEFSFHVEMETSRLVAEGVPAAEARRRAMLSFGGLDQHREAMRDGRGARWFDDLSADVRYALRSMRRSPGFAVAVALTLGIGVNGLTFSYINSVLFRPMPARNPSELVGVFTLNTPTGRPGLAMYDDYLDLRDRSGIFADLAGRTDGPLNLALTAASTRNPQASTTTDLVWGEFVTENYFTLLGNTPALGRYFTPADAPGGANALAVLSYDSWRTRFNSDPSVAGRAIRLNGTEFTITGVAPKGFHGVRTFGFWPELFVPIGMHKVLLPGSKDMLQGRGDGWMMLVGRMKPGWSEQRTAIAVRQFAQLLERQYPATNRAVSLMVVPAASGFDHPAFVKPKVLQLASALGAFAALMTLLIVCANLANLQLARAKARAREIAIRLSLGCSRARLTRQLLVESVLVALPGLALATAIVCTSSWFEHFLVPQLQFHVGLNAAVDVRVAAYTAGIALVAVALFGLAPALGATRLSVAPSMVSVVGTRRQGARRGDSMRTALVVSQLALSVVLLVAGTLFVRSLFVARNIDVGFDVNDRLLVSINSDLQGYDQARGLRLYRQVAAQLQGTPAVEAASWAFPVPFDTYGRGTSLYVEGATTNSTDPTVTVNRSIADVGFTEAMGLRLQSGREFTLADSAGAPLTMVVSRQLAARLWPGRDAVGQRARLNSASGAEILVVGVAADARYGMIGETNQMHAYLPLAQNYRGWLTLMVHARQDPALIERDVRAAVAAIDPILPTFGVTTMRRSVANGFSTHQTAAGAGGFFGAMSLLIAAIGLYAVVAGSVAERTREIGVRMALGATPRGVMRLIMQGSVRMAAIGMAIGLLGAAAVAQSMRGLLYGVSANDPATFVFVPLVFAVVVLTATCIPALRAVRMSPVLALRNE